MLPSLSRSTYELFDCLFNTWSHPFSYSKSTSILFSFNMYIKFVSRDETYIYLLSSSFSAFIFLPCFYTFWVKVLTYYLSLYSEISYLVVFAWINGCNILDILLKSDPIIHEYDEFVDYSTKYYLTSSVYWSKSREDISKYRFKN